MTDNEIIKALECCKTTLSEIGACKECPLYQGEGHTCITTLSKNALDLINRQNEEIDRLLKAINDKHCVYEKRVVSEAIKEFWEKLKGEVVPTITAMFIISEILVAHSKREISPERALTKIREELLLQNPICSRPKLEEVIDNLVKEMVGE